MPPQSTVPETKPCIVCGTPFAQRPDELPSRWRYRRTCNRVCARAATIQGNLTTGRANRYARSPQRGMVPVGRTHFALVDEADFDRVMQLAWKINKGNMPHTLYAENEDVGLLHRYILGADAPPLIDHINGNGLDCRRENMRAASPSQNASNRHSNREKHSPYKGVTPKKGGKWSAQIKVKGEKSSLGYFDSPEDAAHAYDAAARKHFGEFARLNFPNEGEQSAIRPAKIANRSR